MIKRFFGLSITVLAIIMLIATFPIQVQAQDNYSLHSVTLQDKDKSVGWSLGNFVFSNSSHNFLVFTHKPVVVTIWPGAYLASANNTYKSKTLVILDGLYDESVVLGLYAYDGIHHSPGFVFDANVRSNRLELKIDQKVYVGHEYEVSFGSKVLEIKLVSIKSGKAIFEIRAID